MPLKRLGPYEIGKPLGKGGMGSVYEATNVDTGERVAVKALTPHLAMAEGFRERFEAEIESLKALRHDGIVRLYGYGEQNGVLFYSMELVEGVSLEDEIKAGRRFNWREVTNIAIQLSLALKHAHDHGIVHRDIKPANILLYGDDKVKLADFGIARLFGTNQLTTAGGVLGTADYMSPEQADGRPVTARCDQYSLGGVMYALLAGRPPFRANNLPQMLQLQRFAQPEPVRRYAPDVPEQLERLIGQLLAKEPAERYPNMQVLARHLQAMAKALSRPTADDFALVGDDPGGKRPDADWGHSISIELTQAESEAPRRQGDAQATTPETPRPAKPGGPSSAQGDVSPQEAATLAAEEMPAIASKPASNGAAAKPQAISRDRVREAPERPTRFTTVEEDEARRQAQQQRSWLLMAAQLGLLGTVLAGMGGLAYYLSLPPSADQLFQAVSSEADLDSPDSLAKVENEVNEFLERYPADPRAPQVQRYQEQLMLDKLERKLLRQVRDGNIDSALLPIEQLYMQAMSTAQLAPDSAATMLRSLIDLHPAGVPITSGASGDEAVGETAAADDTNARMTAIIQLAERRLAKLEVDIARQNERQLAALGERLEAAGRLTASEPQQAAAMYRAIIDLHEKSTWASEIVAQARERLAELDSRNDR